MRNEIYDQHTRIGTLLGRPCMSSGTSFGNLTYGFLWKPYILPVYTVRAPDRGQSDVSLGNPIFRKKSSPYVTCRDLASLVTPV